MPGRVVMPHSIPHACGGEPHAAVEIDYVLGVFPTRVGVNRLYR